MKRLLRFLRRDSGRELADEMREHVREKIEDLADSGMERADAEAEARRRFGNQTSLEERSRDEWDSRSRNGWRRICGMRYGRCARNRSSRRW